MKEKFSVSVSRASNKEFERQMDELIKMLTISEKDIARAISRALNRVAGSMKSKVSHDLARELKIRLKIIAKRLKVFRASGKKPSAMVSMFTFAMPLGAWEVWPYSKGIKTKGGDYYTGAFYQPEVRTNKSNKKRPMVFVRKARPRYPISEVRRVIKPEAEEALGRYARGLEEKLKERILHELKVIGGYFKKVGENV